MQIFSAKHFAHAKKRNNSGCSVRIGCTLAVSPSLSDPPTPYVKDVPPQEHTESSETSHQNAEKQQTPPQNLPIRIDTTISGQLNIETKNTESSSREEHDGFWYSLFWGAKWTDILLALFTLLLVIVGAKQASQLRATITQMKAAEQRELRAYVFAESGSIINVAEPAGAPGEVIPRTAAALNAPGRGPTAQIVIRNSGQTPAYHVEHWGNNIFREFPLEAGLPGKPPGLRPGRSNLGPGVSSTKPFFFRAPLTPAQTADLRAGNAALYIYGEICYRDAFGKKWRTTYRLMHHAMGGAIGVSNDLSFCEEGNDETEKN